MEHEAGSNHHEQEACLRRHVATPLVLVIQFLKDLIVVIHVFVNRLGPTIELSIKGIELVVHQL